MEKRGSSPYVATRADTKSGFGLIGDPGWAGSMANGVGLGGARAWLGWIMADGFKD